MRTESLASSQSGRSVDADTWCKRALKVVSLLFLQVILFINTGAATQNDKETRNIHTLTITHKHTNKIQIVNRMVLVGTTQVSLHI